MALGQSGASIEGRVRFGNGINVPTGIKVRLKTAEGSPVDERLISSDGEYAFEGVLRTHYRLVIAAEGYLPVDREVDLTRAESRVVVNLELTPAQKTEQKAASGIALVTDLRAPAKAQKEYARGARALEERHYPEARKHYEKAIDEYPCYARAQADLALTLYAAHELAGSEAALKKAIECEPSFLDAYAQLGQLLNAEKRFAESETLLQQALRRGPAVWQLDYQLGLAEYGLGEYSKAEETYLKVRSLNSSPPSELFIKLSDVYVKQRAFDKAYEELQAYLHADPNGQFAPRVKDIMRQMKAAGVLSASKPQ